MRAGGTARTWWRRWSRGASASSGLRDNRRRHVPDRGREILAHHYVVKSRPQALPVIARRERGGELQVRHDDEELPPIAIAEPGAIGALADLELMAVPGEGVMTLQIETGEVLRGAAGGFRSDRRLRVGGFLDPRGAHDAAPFPLAAIKEDLPDLQDIARTHERSAAKVALARRHHVPVPVLPPEGPGDQPVEELRH